MSAWVHDEYPAGTPAGRPQPTGKDLVPLALGGAFFAVVLAPRGLVSAALLTGAGYAAYRRAKRWAGAQLDDREIADHSSQGAAELEALLADSAMRPAAYPERRPTRRDDVDEASMESFPASDPPSSSGTTAAPAGPVQLDKKA